MEQRKIVSLGRSSLVVSLPKYWIKMNELKQGDSVSLAIQRDRSLVIFPSGEVKKEDKTITLDVESGEEPASVTRRIIACYLNGYFGIRLGAKNIFTVPQQRAIREIVGKLYMRIMETDAKSIYIQTLIDETKASIDSGVNRMHAITVSMYRDALNSLRKMDGNLARIVYSLDDDVDHFSFFVLRLITSAATDPILANQLDFDPIDCLHYQTLVHRIEQVADRAKNIARYVIMLESGQPNLSNSILDLVANVGNEAFNAYDRAVKAFFSKDVTEANQILGLRDKIEKLDIEVTSKFFSSEVRSSTVCCGVCSIRDNIKDTMEHSMDIAEITIDSSYKEK